MADTYWAEREGARWDVYGKQRGWMAQTDTEDDARLIVAGLEALQAQQPAAAVPAEPIGWVFQQEDTGRMTFCANDGINTPEVFQRLNPRYALCSAAYTQAQQPAAAVPEGYALVKVQYEERDGFWSFSDNEENFVGEECDTELDAIAAALDYYGDDLETVYVGQAKRIDKARLVRGDHIIELIGEAAGEEVGEFAYDWPRISKDECAELERIVMGYVLSKSPAGFFTVENSREYTREQAEEMLAAANKEKANEHC